MKALAAIFIVGAITTLLPGRARGIGIACIGCLFFVDPTGLGWLCIAADLLSCFAV